MVCESYIRLKTQSALKDGIRVCAQAKGRGKRPRGKRQGWVGGAWELDCPAACTVLHAQDISN